jgi:iron complex outermembrane receptor protein
MRKSLITGLLAGVAVFALPTAALAQRATSETTARATDPGEIIVTARKRTETLMDVPVVATAVSGETLDRMQTNDLKSLARMVPGLSMGTSILSVGQLVSLRGVGTSALDPGVDASVSLNIDGLSLSQGLAYASGMFDVGQVEVLKGPQNLFYGKSSPGGVISLRTADPTDEFEVMGRAGYEFEARTLLLEGVVSGPLAEGFKVRLAGQYGTTDGYFKNTAIAVPNSGAAGPASNRNGDGDYYKIRGTLIVDPSELFDARIKLNYVHDDIRNSGQLQNVVCPDGVNAPLGRFFVQPTDQCKLDRFVPSVDQNNAAFPAFSYPGNKNLARDGVPYNKTEQFFGTAELNFHIRPDLTLTSQTGYYKVHAESLFNGTTSSANMGLFNVTNDFHREQFTEELRLTSNFQSPLNFTIGGYIERSSFSDDVTIARNVVGFPLAAGSAPTAVFVQKGFKDVKVEAESLFGQLLYKITPQLELAAGARWTNERRSEVGEFLNPATGVVSVATFARPAIQAKNVAPELSITFRPNEDLTIFGNLKKGYKSGSFNVSTPPFNGENNAFDDEEVKGGELGVKARLLDRRLNLEAAFFYYKYSGLQVGANVQATNGVTVTRTVNAGEARSYGLEASLSYRPAALDGLTLRLAGLYNDTKYTSLTNVPCYGGQLVSEGCNLLFARSAAALQTPAGPAGGVFQPAAQATNPGGVVVGGTYGFWGFNTAQDRSGLPLIRAPKWSANFGFDYEFDLGSDLRFAIANNNQWQSRSLVNLGYIYFQEPFIKADLSLSLKGRDDRWEFALIGKNLNNEVTSGNCSNGNRMAGNAGGLITGGVARGIAGTDEVGCWADTGRELWVRATVRY